MVKKMACENLVQERERFARDANAWRILLASSASVASVVTAIVWFYVWQTQSVNVDMPIAIVTLLAVLLFASGVGTWVTTAKASENVDTCEPVPPLLLAACGLAVSAGLGGLLWHAIAWQMGWGTTSNQGVGLWTYWVREGEFPLRTITYDAGFKQWCAGFLPLALASAATVGASIEKRTIRAQHHWGPPKSESCCSR